MYIRQKRATLHKYFIIFNTQSQKLYLQSENFNKKCDNRGICQESSAGF